MSSHAEQQGARINELNNGIVQQGVAEKYLQKAVVMLPSGNVQNFFVHKKSKGNVLTDLVSEHEGLLEKDYFGLNYVDNYGEKTWLYPNKRIAKQLKSVPWNFTLRVKFYAPEPSVLADDLTRYLLYLQIRKDVYDEVLPTSYPTKILLAGIVMQVEIGDFETSEQSAKEYDLFVRNACLVHSVDQEFLAKVREAHKEQKGLTTQEAHLKYLDAAKVLAKYGYTFFQGKDVKNANVTIGIHAHGISVYKDQVQIHKFWWQSIEKIQYSSNKFSILLKPGELDEKKQVTVRFSLPDYYTAKRLYRTAVEHHTFFRLIRPEDSPKNGLLSRVSSERFRYQGRTYFQAKMASQMFDNPTTTVQRTPSGRQVSRSVDDLAVQRSFSPLHYADESTHQATSPEKSKSYSLTTKNKDKRTPLSVVVHETQETPLGSKRSSTSSASIVSPFSSEYIVSSKPYTFRDEATTSPYEDVVFPLAKSLSENQRKQTITKSSASTSQRHSRVRFFEGTGPITPNDGSAVAMAPAIKPGKRTAKRRLFGPVNDDHTAFSPVDNLNPSPKLINMPLDSRVSVYNCGWYTATLPSTSSTQQNVPFFVCCKPTKAVRHEYNSLCDFDNGIICQSKLYKRNDLDSYPLRYYSSVYHSGFPPTKSKKWAVSKDDDVIPANRLNPKYYAFKTERSYSSERFEPIREIESVPLRQVSRVYWHGGFRKPNTNVVEVTPQSRFVQTISTLKKAIPSSLTNVERSFTEHGLPVDEVKNTTVEHSGQSDDACTITTTRIKTPVIFEPEAEPSTSKTYISPLHTKSVVEESVSSGGHSPVTETCAGPFDVVSKSCELELLPIKRFANVYHPGVSEEKVTPITWIRKQKTILIDCRRDSNRPTTSKTSKSSLLSKSAHYEKLTKKRLHSLSQHYPVIGEVYESPLKTLSPTTEAQSADLFDCVSFSSIDELKSSDITEVQFQNVKQIKKVKDAPKKKPMDQKNCTTDIHKKRWLHEFHTYKNIEKCKLSIDTNKSNDITHTENAFKVSAPHVTVTSENQLYESHQNQSTNPFSTQEQPIRVIDYELSRTNSGKSQVDTEVFIVDQPQSARNTEEVYATQKPVPSANAVYSLITLWCGKRNNAIDEPYTSTHQLYQNKSIANSEKRYSLSQNYPVIGESFEGDCVTLSHQPEAKSVDLFDTISFASSSGDSGVAGDTVIQRSKSKKRGLNCLWCGKRNNAIDEPYNRTHQLCHNESITNSEKRYLLSRNYPVIGESFEGDCATLSHQPEAKSVDLFDTISFASSSGDSGVAGDTAIQRSKSKKRGLNCLWCTPSKSQRKTSKESFKLVSIHEQQMQRNRFVHKARTYSTSEHYPTAQVPHKFEVFEISKAVEIPDVNLFDTISFASSSGDSDVSGDTASQRSKSKKRGLSCLWCGKRNNAFDEPYNRTHQLCHNESITNSEKCYSLSQNYPVIGESFEGDCVTLSHQPEAKSVDLFDTISFASSSGDSGVAGDTAIQRSKSKKRGLNCLWCTPSKSQRKTSKESFKLVSIHEQQMQRNRFVHKARTYSTSEHYPTAQVPHKFEVFEISKAVEIPAINLFDAISFASSTDDKQTNTEVVHKQKIPKCGLFCTSCLERPATLPEPDDNSETLEIRREVPFVSKVKYGERPITPIAVSVPMSKQEIVVESPTLRPIKKVVDRVEMKTVQRFNKPSSNAACSVLTEPYDGSFPDLPKDYIAAGGILIEHVDFQQKTDDIANATTSHKIEESLVAARFPNPPTKRQVEADKGCDLRCGKRNNAIDEPYNRTHQLCHNESITNSEKRYLLSRNYPVIGESFEGDCVTLSHQPEAKSVDLFDTISFASSSGDSGVAGDTAIQRSKSKKRGLNCLWCTPSKSQRKTSKESFKLVSIHEQQMQRNRFVHKARTYSTSEHYPTAQVPHKFEVFEISKAVEIPDVNLFDTISFASSSGDSDVSGDTASQRSKSKKRGLNCLWCGKRNNAIDEPYNRTHQLCHNESITNSEKRYSLSQNYPVIGESFEGDCVTLSHQPEAKSVDLFDTISFASSSGDSGVAGDTVIQRSKSKKRGLSCLWCGKRNNAFDEPYNRTHQLCHNESITNSEKCYSLSQNYPVIGESFEGDCVTLSHQPEAKSVDLFDTISFASSSGDSGVAGDTAIQRSKSKKRGLNCLWCTPSKSQRKTSKESFKLVSIHEQQMQRNRFVHKARTYSTSEHYPTAQVPHKFEVFEISKAVEIPAINLFDAISFASSTDDKQTNTEVVHKQKIPKCGLFCTSCLERPATLPEPDDNSETLEIRREVPFVSKVKYGERPITPIAVSVPMSKQEIVVESPTLRPIKKVVDRVEMKTVQRFNKPSSNAACSVLTEPYDGSFPDLPKDYIAAGGILIEHVDFQQKTDDIANATTSHKIEESLVAARFPNPPTKRQVEADKGCDLRCGKRNNAIDEPYNRTHQLCHNESITNSEKRYLLSRNYPVIGESFEGDCVTLSHQPEAKSVDLFDTISFASSSGDSGVAGDTAIQRSKSKKRGLNCLWCTPSKSQRKTSKESFKLVSIHEQQMQRNRFVHKARTYSTSEHYPTAQVPHKFEVFEISKAVEIPDVNLFDTISFASSSGDSDVSGDTASQRSKSKKRGLNCLWCGKRNNAIDEPYNRTHQLCHNESITNSEKRYSLSQNYPVIGESFEGDCVTLSHQPEAKSVDLFDTISFASSSGDSGVAGDTVIQRSKSKKRGLSCLWCGKRNNAFDEPYNRTHQLCHNESITNSEKCYSLSQNYPVIGESFEGDCVTLSHQPEAKSVDLFDTISFASSSGDSGVAGDTAIQRSKSKKRGLNCLWCTPSKSQRKTSKESFKLVSIHEQQMQRNRFVHKARTYSTSEHYPTAQVPHKFEVFEISKAVEIPAINLFDAISFASSTDDKQTNTEVVHKQKIPKCGLFCTSCLERPATLPEPDDNSETLEIRREVPFVSKVKYGERPITPIAVSVPMSKQEIVVESPTLRPIKKVVDRVEMKTVQRFNKPSSNAACSVLTEPYDGSFPDLPKDYIAAGGILIEHVDFQQKTDDIANATTSHKIEESLVAARFPNPPTKRQVEADKGCDLRCGKRNNAIDEPYNRTHQLCHNESITNSEKRYLLSRNYPVIGESFEGDCVTLSHQPEAKSVDLFDTISFASSSGDSGVAGDTAIQRSKSKKRGLNCLWCTPSKSQRKTSKESFKLVSIHEQQMQRNRFVHKARTYSTSEHYPTAQVPHKFEVFEISKAVEIPDVNLFDTISFASSSGDSDVSGDTASQRSKSKKRGLNCLWCGKRNNAIDEPYNRTHQLCHNESITNSEKRYSLSQNYPVIGESFEGDCATLSHQPEAKSVDLFDTISFASSSGDSDVSGDTASQRSKSKKRGLNCLWCGKRNNAIDEPYNRTHQLCHNELITNSEKRYSLSRNYPVVGESFEGDCVTLSHQPEAKSVDLFDTISFASSSGDSGVAGDTVIQRSKSKKRGLSCLWCGKRNNAFDEPYNRTHQLCHNESITNSEKRYSLSRNYPVVGESFEGDCVTLSHQPEAKSVDLFDTISFASSSGDSDVSGDTASQRSKSKKRGLNCLWCGKRNNAIDEPYNRTHQLCHNELITNSEKRYSLSRNYPVVGESFEGDCVTLSHQPEAKSVDLFDTISFASSSGDSDVSGDTASQRSKSKKRGLNCLWCGKRNNAIDEPYNRTHQLCHNELITNSEKRYSLSRNYPVVGESFEGDCVTLSHQPEAKSVDLFDTISFASSSGDSDVSGDTASQRSKSKKRGLNCLWCTPSKSQRKTSKESFKLVSIHEQQMQRNRFVHKARTYSTSEHYPTAQVPHKFEVFEISKAVEIPAINLFDAISFASSTDDKQTNTEVVHKQKIPKCGLFCTSCLERPATLPEVDESYETIDFRREVPFVPTVKFGKRPISLVEGSVLMPTQDSHHPSGPHNVCNVSQSNGLPVCALSSMDTVFLPDHAKRSVPSRRGGKVPFSTFKRKYFKTRHAASVDGDCSSQSADELSKSSLKQKRTESEGFLSFFGSRFSPLTSTKTGFEGLMTIDDTNVKAIVLEANLSNTSIRDYVHVYHHGYSNVHQTIDSGFEDGLNTSETEVKCKDTLTMKKSKSFFEDLKRGIKRLSVDEQIKPESVVEVLTPSTPVQCEPFNRTLYSELHSSTKSAADLDSATLSTVVDEIPSGSYCRDMSKPVDFVVPTQKPVEHEQFLTLTKPTLTKLFSEESKQKRDLSYAYGMSFANSESDHNQVFKKSDVLKHPFCESASVNHLDKSDVLITQMPADFFEVSPERTISTQHPNSALTSEFESFAETNVPLEGSSVLSCQQVVITDSDQTETPKTSYSFNKNASEVILTSTPLADKVSTEPLQEQTVVHCSRRSNNRDVSKRKTRVAEASKDCNRRGVAQRFIAVFQKNSKLLEGYPEISLLCAYRGPLADFIRSKDLDQHYLHSFTNVYHSGFSDDKPSRKAQKILKKERQRALKNLKVDLNDYPHDDKAVSDAHIFNLHFIHDASQSPTPVTIPVDTFYHCRSHPRHRFLQRLCRNRQSRTSETAVTFYDALSRRDDYSTDTFSMVVSDKSLFTLGHWPVTDIDVDVVLTKQRRIDCEFETTVNTKCAYNSAIAGRTALSHVNVSLESGTVSSANCCRIHQHPEGFWYAEVSATLTVPQQQEEAVDDAIEVSRGTVVITEEPSFDYDLSHLVDDEVMSKSWVGNTSDYGLSSQIGDSLTRLSLASDDNDNIMFSAITRDLSEKLSKKSKKEEEKRRKKEDKEAAKRSKKNKKPSGDGTIKKPSSGGGDADSVSSTSSSSESPTEHKKHHVAVGQAVAGPVEPLSTNQELVVLHGIPERHQITMAPQTAAVNHIDDNSSGPYTPAKNNDGRVLREETIEQVYRISGNGKVPKFDLTDMSLQAAVDNYVRETDKVPRIEMVEANILVRENEPLPQALREGSAPHTTVHTWYETEADPEQVTTEIDKYGNKVTRTVKTQHTKHTIQKQSYQTYAVDGSFLPEQQTVIETTEETSPLGSDAVARSPVVHTKTRTVAYEKDSQNELTEPLGDFVSSKTITTGNRTVEILTYKTEKDGVVETRVEHRVTIHSGTDIDHDAELVTALLEATQMSPDLLINRVEVEKSAQS